MAYNDGLSCHVCGMRFRSMAAEARHRHNFPALCKTKRLTKKEWREAEADRRDHDAESVQKLINSLKKPVGE